MPPSPRKSLAAAFPDLQIGSGSASSLNAINGLKKVNLLKSLRKTMRGGRFPPWGSIKGRDVRAKFTIGMDGMYDYYSLSHYELDPDDLFKEAQEILDEVTAVLLSMNEAQEKALEDYTSNILATMVFGSNFIEKAGTSFDITLKICQAIFAGDEVPEISERDPEYAENRKYLINVGRDSSYTSVIRSRNEIIQHALALKYINLKMVVQNEPLTEELLKETHAILIKGLTTEDGDASEEYGGQYRTDSVAAGLNTFVAPERIPRAMRILIRDFERDVAEAEEKGKLDPFSLAAKYCHKLVNIHPFLDGNGRMCRLLLNAILLKYAGIIISLGEKEADRERYLQIAAEATISEQYDEDERIGQPWSKLQSLVIQESVGIFRTLRDKLKR